MRWAGIGTSTPLGRFQVRSFERFAGTRLDVMEGVGDSSDPFRYVTYWFDENGDLIQRNDPNDDVIIRAGQVAE